LKGRRRRHRNSLFFQRQDTKTRGTAKPPFEALSLFEERPVAATMMKQILALFALFATASAFVPASTSAGMYFA